MNDDQRAELLMDHYKDTFQHILFHWKARNRLFVFILILLAGICVDLYQPGFFSQLANAYLSKKLGPSAPGGECPEPTVPDVNFLVTGSVVWFLLLCLVINYYQRSIHVDRQYTYLAGVEKRLNGLFGMDLVSREGRSYQSRTGIVEENTTGQRPLFLRAVGHLYTLVFPLALMTLCILKIWSCWPAQGTSLWFSVIDTLIGVALIAYNGLYLRWRCCKK